MRILLVGASPAGSSLLVAGLAAQHDHVIAVDGGGALCLEADITPNKLIGDLDSLPVAALRALEARGIPLQRYPAEKDETDLVLALRSAHDSGATSLTLTAVLGARPDHTLAGLGAVAAAADLRPMIEEADVAAAVLGGSGATSCIVRPTGATFSTVALGGPGCISVEGARWPLDHARLAPLAALGVSNVVVDDQAIVRSHSGMITVFAPTVDGVRATLEYED